MGQTESNMGKKLTSPLLILIIFGLTIGILSIIGISNSNLDPEIEANLSISSVNISLLNGLFIGVLVLVILSFCIVVFLNCSKGKEASSYQVNDSEKGKVEGKDNAGFENDGKKGAVKEPWMDNYIPYGNLPAGKGGVTDEKKDVSKDSADEKWKQNYVEYE